MAICQFLDKQEVRGEDKAWRRQISCVYQGTGKSLGAGYVDAGIQMVDLTYSVVNQEGIEIGKLEAKDDQENFPLETFLWISHLKKEMDLDTSTGKWLRQALAKKKIDSRQVEDVVLVQFTTPIPVLLTTDQEGKTLVKTDQKSCALGRVMGSICDGKYTYSYGSEPWLVWTGGTSKSGGSLSLPYRAYVCSSEEEEVIQIGLQRPEDGAKDWWKYSAQNTVTGDILTLELNRHSDQTTIEARWPLTVSQDVGCKQIDDIFHPEKAISQGRMKPVLSQNSRGELEWSSISSFDGMVVRVEFKEYDYGKKEDVIKTVSGKLNGESSKPDMIWLSTGYHYGIYVNKIVKLTVAGRQAYP
jgi:hypothetical protein